MFKSVRGAGFNKETFPTLKDTILVSEPEAASYFTARDLRDTGTEFLEVSHTVQTMTLPVVEPVSCRANQE